MIYRLNKIIYILLMLSNIYPCAVCSGAPDHLVTQGMNNAIIFLLLTIIFVLSCIGASILILMKKAKAVKIQRSPNDR